MIVEFIYRYKVIKTLNLQSPIFDKGMGVRIEDKIYNVSYTVYDTNRNILEVHL